MKRLVNLRVVFDSDAIAETGEARRQLGPERQALAYRNVGVYRPEACDMLALHLAGHAPVCIRLA